MYKANLRTNESSSRTGIPLATPTARYGLRHGIHASEHHTWCSPITHTFTGLAGLRLWVSTQQTAPHRSRKAVPPLKRREAELVVVWESGVAPSAGRLPPLEESAAGRLAELVGSLIQLGRLCTPRRRQPYGQGWPSLGAAGASPWAANTCLPTRTMLSLASMAFLAASSAEMFDRYDRYCTG